MRENELYNTEIIEERSTDVLIKQIKSSDKDRLQEFADFYNASGQLSRKLTVNNITKKLGSLGKIYGLVNTEDNSIVGTIAVKQIDSSSDKTVGEVGYFMIDKGYSSLQNVIRMFKEIKRKSRVFDVVIATTNLKNKRINKLMDRSVDADILFQVRSPFSSNKLNLWVLNNSTDLSDENVRDVIRNDTIYAGKIVREIQESYTTDVLSENHNILMEDVFSKISDSISRPDKAGKVRTYEVDVFKGNFYTGKSTLEKRRFLPWLIKSQVKSHPMEKFKPIFVLGYKLSDMNINYEIWYSTNYGVYKIFDKYGKSVGAEQHDMMGIVNTLMDIIWKVEDISPIDRRSFDQELKAEISASKSKFEQVADDIRQQQESDFYEDVEIINESMLDKDTWITSANEAQDLYESAISTLSMLTKAITDKVEQYNDTRMERHKISRMWQPILKKKIEFPTKYFHTGLLGGVSKKVRKIFGVDKEATFVIGFTLENKIDFEIWYVKGIGEDVESKFHVFDLNSAKEIGRGFRTIRQAMGIIEKKVALPKSYAKVTPKKKDRDGKGEDDDEYDDENDYDYF